MKKSVDIQTYDVRFSSVQGITTYNDVLEHQLVDLKGGTHHKLTFAGDVILYVNDFGISTVLVTPSGAITPKLP